jgi:ribosome biogenesis SPOUT family RNA methylase Rps3
MKIKYVVEHLEEEMFEWCVLEYANMAKHVGALNLIITNITESELLKDYPTLKDCILTSKGIREMQSIDQNKIILLDQCAENVLSVKDCCDILYILCGGILGTDEFDGPMVDRTEYLRNFGYKTRNLGSVQMTADTAMIVSYKILQEGKEFSDLKFCDKPSIQIRKKEFLELPFRYLENEGKPLVPEGLIDYCRNNDF